MIRFLIGTAIAAQFAAASSLAFSQQNAGDQEMGEVHIESSKEREVAPFNPTQSTTTVDSAQLEMKQPESIFDAVRDVPGVMINGGPRPSGMTFNIRGYNDNEDVRIKLDGVTKQFEKYRFGGTFIEPEMLKSIEVQRGPQIASGSGALGGTVSATTKSASDLLPPGQRSRARKSGLRDQQLRDPDLPLAFGRPTGSSDLLVNILKRDADNYKLPNGSTYQYSETNTQSGLLKGSAFLLDDLMLTASLIAFDDSGPQPYDATGGNPGIGGIVSRTVKDRTFSTTLNYEPGGRWLNTRGTVGYSNTKLHDVIRPELSNGLTTPYPPGGGVFNDYYDYDIWNLDLANTSAIGKVGGISISVLTGLQYERNTRDVVRLTQNPAYNAPQQHSIPEWLQCVAATWQQDQLCHLHTDTF